jgi:hypothetical protein
MCEALNHFGQRARFERYQVTINSIRMLVKDNTISSDSGKTSFHGAGQFLTLMFYEGILIGADRDKILQYYNSLVQSKSFVTK